MRTLLRFSAAVAFSRDRRQFWRQVSMVTGAALATLAFLLTLILPIAAVQSQQRAALQPPVLTESPPGGVEGMTAQGAVAATVARGTLINGKQVTTIWVEPLPGFEEDPRAIPQGLRTLPGPGEAVLSPALATNGVTPESLGWSSSNAGNGPAGTIGLEGLVAASDALIFVRPQAGRTVGDGGAVEYVASFSRDVPSEGTGFSGDLDVIPLQLMAPGTIAFLGIPAFVLLVSATRARSTVRDDRMRFLIRLGVRETRARLALALESAMLGAVGAVGAAALYAIIGPFLAAIPFTTIRLLPGALTAPAWAYVLVIAAVIASSAILGAMGRLSPRSSSARHQALLRLAPGFLSTAIGLVILSAAAPLPPSFAQLLLTAGILSTLVTLPLSVAPVTRRLATALSHTSRPHWWAAGHRLRADSVHLSRVPAVLAALLVVVSLAISLWGASVAVHKEHSTRSSNVVSVSWRGAPPERIDAARKALDEAGIPVLVLAEVSLDDSAGPTPPAIKIENCAQFVTFFDGEPERLCDPAAFHELSDFSAVHTGMRPPEPNAVVIPPESYARGAHLVSRTGIEVAEVQRELAFLPALNIELRPQDTNAPFPTTQWVLCAGIIAFMILALAIVREMGDRSVEDAERDQIYRRLGLSETTIDGLAWAVLLVPLGVAVVLGFVSSLIIAYGGEVQNVTRGDPVKLVIVALIAVAVVILAIALTLPVRRASRFLPPR